MDRYERSPVRYLIMYYGILQISHMIVLARASVMYLQSDSLPFPASPPVGGWTPQVLPYLYGMGAVDAVAAGLGVVYAYLVLRNRVQTHMLGMISLTSAITSALVFGAGTLASGAWAAHPLEYGSMVVLFTPLLFLYTFLFREDPFAARGD